MLVEGQGSGDDCERFLDGVSRLCARAAAGFERRTAGLLKQHRGAARAQGRGRVGSRG